jgi:hypothetical protein
MNSINSIAAIYSTPLRQADDGDFQLLDKIEAKLRNAALLESMNPEGAAAEYEEAGRLCLELYARGISFGHLHPCLVAGLCFEKSAATSDRAQAAYLEICASIPDLLISVTDEEINNCPLSIYFTAPMYREAAFASLKCGKEGLFLDLMASQTHRIISACNMLADQECKEIPYLCSYLRSIINLTSEIVGPSHPVVLEMKNESEQLYKNLESKGIKTACWNDHQIDVDLLNIYLSDHMSVIDKLHSFTDNMLIQP